MCAFHASAKTGLWSFPQLNPALSDSSFHFLVMVLSPQHPVFHTVQFPFGSSWHFDPPTWQLPLSALGASPKKKHDGRPFFSMQFLP